MARIYTIKHNSTGEVTGLVRAANKTAALRHIAESVFSVKPASQDELVAAISSGTAVQDAIVRTAKETSE